jgi:hypothetical protein
MTTQFQRRARLVIGTTEIEDLGISFHITKSLKPQPNQAEIKVRNLAPTTRKLLEEPKTLPCQLQVAYADEALHSVFLGTVRSARSVKDGLDIVTTVATGDDAHVASRPSVQVPAKATPQQLLDLVAKQLGVGTGNLGEVLSSAIGGGPVSATVVSGRGPEMFTQLCRSAGLEWSVQNGALQILPLGKPVSLDTVLLSSNPNSGLVGSPSVDNKGVLSARALIQPDLEPGRLVVFEAKTLKGAYRLEEVVLAGDTRGTDWYADMHGRKY